MDKICYTYGGARQVFALQDISLTIGAGEFIAISGPSGSGKSTLMHIMGCMLTPTSGGYRLLGEEVAGRTSSQMAKIRNSAIGFVFQNFNLLPRASALNNVALPLIYAGIGGKERREKAQEVLKKVGLGKRISHHPNELSGGEKQRVAIARAIVTRPRILLADEPTGNLDRATGKSIIAMLKDLAAEGMTIIFVSHDLEMVAEATRSIQIIDSRLAG
ncbi:MAG: ABC transporter ATP-binding protein [Proteobacteria bacterium]|nr:ABC transporter ATP-binding protein [Pseudomonadota bacterium]MBU1715674.1 ABC transporter ATP-binding protein [Pseudomonadota bacterium]